MEPAGPRPALSAVLRKSPRGAAGCVGRADLALLECRHLPGTGVVGGRSRTVVLDASDPGITGTAPGRPSRVLLEVATAESRFLQDHEELHRAPVQQAVEMLAAQIDGSRTIALRQLLDQARRTHRPIGEVALDVISHRLTID